MKKNVLKKHIALVHLYFHLFEKCETMDAPKWDSGEWENSVPLHIP